MLQQNSFIYFQGAALHLYWCNFTQSQVTLLILYIYIFFFRSVSDAHFIYFSPNGNSLPGVPFYHCISIWDSSLWVSFFPLSRLFSSQSTHRQVTPRVLSQRGSCSIRFIFWLCLPRLAPIFWDNMFLLFWLALFCRCKNVIKDLVLLYACG